MKRKTRSQTQIKSFLPMYHSPTTTDVTPPSSSLQSPLLPHHLLLNSHRHNPVPFPNLCTGLLFKVKGSIKSTLRDVPVWVDLTEAAAIGKSS